MKFPQAARAAEGLSSYARVSRIRPLHLLITVLEGLFGLAGVVVIILTVRYGSFEKAGLCLDQSIAGAVAHVEKLVHRS